jgi:echinoderm microtubule-associated protein-like 6
MTLSACRRLLSITTRNFDHALLLYNNRYAGQKGRQNITYTADGSIVYPAASAGVVVTRERTDFSARHDPTAATASTATVAVKQAHYLGHTREVLCLAAHPSKELVASGQAGAEPVVLVWAPATRATAARLRIGQGKLGVSQVTAFNGF